jgi:fatty acid desaturase
MIDRKTNLQVTLIIIGSFVPFAILAYTRSDGGFISIVLASIFMWFQGIWFLIILGIIISFLGDALDRIGIGKTLIYLIIAMVIIAWGTMMFLFFSDDQNSHDEETYIRTGCESIVAGSRGMECL